MRLRSPAVFKDAAVAAPRLLQYVRQQGELLEASYALDFPGPVLVRVVTDYRGRPIRWIDCARQRYTQELSPAQKVRFLARIGSRALDHHPQND